MTTLTALSAQLTVLLKDDPTPHSPGTEAAINIAFIALTTFSHCLGVKLYGRIERAVMWFKLSLLVLVCVMMVVLNFAGGGAKDGKYNDDYTDYAFTPGWKPSGFHNATDKRLSLSSVSADDFGIPGTGGALFGFITSITLAMFSYGTDLVAMTAGEAKNPWKDVPATMTFVYVIPVIMYPFAMFAAGSNVNYRDRDLSQLWTKGSGPTRSPFVIAAEHTLLHALPRVLNALFILSAYTTANTDLYAASRSVFMLSQQYLPRKVANIFGRTNNGHTPLAAILLCSALGFLSLVGLADRSSSQPTITLSEIYTGTATCINICLCITFLRFKAGLDRLAKRKILEETTRCNLSSPGNLKSTISLAFDVIGAYIGPAIFAFLYLSYKFIYPRTSRVDIRNLTVEDYVLQDLSNIELEGPTCVPPVPRPRFGSYEMDGQNDGIAGPSVVFEDPFKEDQSYADMSPDMQEEIEAEAARSNERARIRQILERRPERLRRGVWREIWSFVRTDKEE
ncbi:unnamed protein product [Alternaria alternata]